jgi:hypothetical protein
MKEYGTELEVCIDFAKNLMAKRDAAIKKNPRAETDINMLVDYELNFLVHLFTSPRLVVQSTKKQEASHEKKSTSRKSTPDAP